MTACVHAAPRADACATSYGSLRVLYGSGLPGRPLQVELPRLARQRWRQRGRRQGRTIHLRVNDLRDALKPSVPNSLICYVRSTWRM